MTGAQLGRLTGAAAELYETVAGLPIVSPHGHVDPALFSDPDARFDDPARLLVVADHYVLRMLYSHGVSLAALGVPTRDGTPVEEDPRVIWQTFADHFHLFRGTPSGVWLTDELATVFGVTAKLTSVTAPAIYDEIAACLASPEFSPRALYQRFGIEVLCTTDAATDTLDHHRRIAESEWAGTILPTFRPDAVIAIDAPDWSEQLDLLAQVSGIDIGGYRSFIAALEQRREHFAAHGAVATDHGVATPSTEVLSNGEAESIFNAGRRGTASPHDVQRFAGHMLCEMARMSCEDGLVMQLHAGVFRDHNPEVLARYGPNTGADIPIRAEFTRNLRPLLARHGNDPRLRMVVFSLDESPYSRELAPLAGHYPAMRIGPPWWFHDSWNGIRRYFDTVMETAGLYNTAGFNDDTRAYPSIPARHDVWRRASARWVAGLAADGLIDDDDAVEMMTDLAVGLARDTYRLGPLPAGGRMAR